MKTVGRRMLVGSLCLGTGGAVAMAQGKLGQRYPLTADAIARALHNDGLDVHPEDVRMPMMLSTAVSDPALEVVGADRLPDGHLRLRLRCLKPGECVGFSVMLAHGRDVSTLLAPAPSATASSTPRTSAASLQAVEPATAKAVESAQPSSDGIETPLSLRPGTKLTMLLDDGHVHIHLPVLLLDNASTGKETRVVTPDHKQMYRAMLLNATTVRGIME